VEFHDDFVDIAVIFGGGHRSDRAVAGAEDDDRDQQGGGEADGEGLRIWKEHFRLLIRSGIIPARQATGVCRMRPRSPPRHSLARRHGLHSRTP
jgi:hypothetical protein